MTWAINSINSAMQAGTCTTNQECSHHTEQTRNDEPGLVRFIENQPGTSLAVNGLSEPFPLPVDRLSDKEEFSRNAREFTRRAASCGQAWTQAGDCPGSELHKSQTTARCEIGFTSPLNFSRVCCCSALKLDSSK